MNTKHTQGPWHVGERVDAGALLPVLDATGSVVALADFDWLANNADKVEGNAHLIAAAPEMLEAGNGLNDLIARAQAILTEYLIPDGLDAIEAINRLLGLLDGSDQRAAQSAWEAVITKAEGRS